MAPVATAREDDDDDDGRRPRSGALFVAVEGVDGSGKTTLTAALAVELRGVNRLVARRTEPSSGPVGVFFRQLSAQGRVDPLAMALLSTADRYEQQDDLADALAGHQVVLSDRYYLSGLAYHAADGIDPAFYQALNRWVRKPDLYLFLDVPPEVGTARRGGRRDGYWERDTIAHRLPDAYEHALALLDDAATAVVRLDALRAPQVVLGAALDALAPVSVTLPEGTTR